MCLHDFEIVIVLDGLKKLLSDTLKDGCSLSYEESIRKLIFKYENELRSL